MTKNERSERVLGAEKKQNIKKKYLQDILQVYVITALVKYYDNSFEKFSKSSVFKYSRFVTVLILSKYVQ